MENYIFISYAHADSDRVLPIVNALEAGGLSLWYDKGIRIGVEWPSYVEEKLLKCGCVIAFVSDPFVDSQNCRNEINLAVSENKDILVIYLADTTLRQGLSLQLGPRQSLFAHKYANPALLLKDVLASELMAKYKVPVNVNDHRVDPPAPPKVDPPKNDFASALAAFRAALESFKAAPSSVTLDAVFLTCESMKATTSGLCEQRRKGCLCHLKKLEVFLQALKVQMGHLSAPHLSVYVETYLAQMTPEIEAMCH